MHLLRRLVSELFFKTVLDWAAAKKRGISTTAFCSSGEHGWCVFYSNSEIDFYERLVFWSIPLQLILFVEAGRMPL